MLSDFISGDNRAALPATVGTGLFAFVLVASSFSLAGCASTSMIQSEVASTPLTIDGDLAEWSTSMQQLGDNPVRVGVKHDDHFVYLSIHSIDETFLRQVMLGGLTVWFNSKGDKTRDLGIKFPIGRTSMAPIRVDPRNLPSPSERTPRILRELEVVDIDGKSVRYPVDGVPGISLKAYLEFGAFSYELKIPLETSVGMTYAVNPGSDGIFGIGLQTGEIDMGELAAGRQRTGGEGVSGGGRRGGARRGGGRRGGGLRGAGSGGFGGLEPVAFWAQVSLVAISE